MKKTLHYHPVRYCRDFRELLYGSEKLYGPRTAFLQKKDGVYQPTTYTEFRDDVNALGSALCRRLPGSRRVMVIGENCYAWALVYMTVLCGAGVIIPTDRECSPEEISNIAALSEADAVFYSGQLAGKIAACSFSDRVQLFCFTKLSELCEEGKELIAEGETAFFDCEIDPKALAVLLFTSGTTGASKGVMLSQENICFDLEEISAMLLVKSDDVALSVLPLHHTYECTCGYLSMIYRGAAIAYCERLSAFAKNMTEVHASMLIAVPALVDSLYKKIWHSAEKTGKADKLRRAIRYNNSLRKVGIDLSSKLFSGIRDSLGGRLRLISCGGAAANPETLRGMRELGLLTVQGYGLTECSPLAAVNSDTLYRDEAAGLCVPRGELSVSEPDENGVGEILYRGRNVMLGYYKNPELTEQVLTDGWFHTGDLGYIDADGFLYITGRKKNVIVTSNGKNIFPEELEIYLDRHPMIGESLVTGAVTDAGETVVKAILVPSPDAEAEAEQAETSGEETRTAALKRLIGAAVAEVNLSLPPFKRIRVTVLRQKPFEKTSSRKIRRAAPGNLSDPDDYTL